MSDIVVYGAGGHARVVADVATSCGHHVTAFVDDASDAPHEVWGRPVWRWDQAAGELAGRMVALGIGDNMARAASAGRARAAGLRVVTLVHERAVVSPSATLGAGVVVMAGAVVNADAILGDGVVVNTGAVVEHDCDVGAYALLGPNCALGGAVTIGERALVGVGASVRPFARVGRQAIVGGGAAVVSDVPDGSTVYGVPARPAGSTASDRRRSGRSR